MGCCSVTQRNTAGVDEVGPDEIELLELSRDNLGLWTVGESRRQPSVKSGKTEAAPRRPSADLQQDQQVVLWGRSRDQLHHRIYSHQPIRDWEGQPAHTYGEIAYSSLVTLCHTYTQFMVSCILRNTLDSVSYVIQERRDHFLVLFSFHLLILSVDHAHRDFVYEGILPLSGLTFRPISWDTDTSHPHDGFEISSAMVDPKVFLCPSAAEVSTWMDHLESTPRTVSPALGPLAYLIPCDEHWKREELKKYLLQMPIRRWEGTPVQRLGEAIFISVIRTMKTQRQGVQERLMVLYPQDVLLLSVDNDMINLTYEGRLARHGVRVVERPLISGRLEFELKGEMLEPLGVSCTSLQDYHTWLFHLKQPKKERPEWAGKTDAPPLPKLPRNGKKPPQDVKIQAKDHPCAPSGRPAIDAHHRRCPSNGRSGDTHHHKCPPNGRPAPGDTDHRNQRPPSGRPADSSSVHISHIF